MDRRLQLQALLSGIPGVKKAFFQEPPADMMEYPCIIYHLDRRESSHADNTPYRHSKRYQVTVMDRDSTSTIPDAVADLPLCSFDRRFVVDKLYHDVFNIYF
jgi:hypothetical protein